jgi:chemosensory pili system protein ChpC
MNDQIYAVLMALDGDTLLLPNAAVVEVISRESVRAVEDAPAWMLGNYEINGRRVPVVSFEALNGAPVPEAARRSRVVVLHSFGRHLEAHAMGVLTQGYPHLVTLNRNAIASAPLRDTDRSSLVLSRVRIASQDALIPDLEAIEAEIQRLDVVVPG